MFGSLSNDSRTTTSPNYADPRDTPATEKDIDRDYLQGLGLSAGDVVLCIILLAVVLLAIFGEFETIPTFVD